MTDDEFKAYVKALTKDQLVDLVLKFAPGTYREEIAYRNLDDVKATKALERISHKIKHLFEDEELFSEPSEFSTSLVDYSEKLIGLWGRFPNETASLFLFCFKKINDIQKEGLLYNSYYDETLNGYNFLNVVREFIWGLPFEQKIAFVSKLEAELSSFSYDTFDAYPSDFNLIYTEAEIPLLKKSFIDFINDDKRPFRKEYYDFLKDTLTSEERELVLSEIYHLDKFLCLELVELLEAMQKAKLAIEFLEQLRFANPNPWVFTEELFGKMVKLKLENGVSIIPDLTEGLLAYESDTFLEKAITYVPQQQLKWEEIIKSVSHPAFYKYLLSKNRVAEAFELVGTSYSLDDSSIYHFYTHYTKKYPEESKKYFIDKINSRLPHTGNEHYESIIDSLKYIRKADKLKCQEIVAMLRKEYKRRKNLMFMLDEIYSALR